MDGHHLRVHAERDVGMVAAASAFERRVGIGTVRLRILRSLRVLLLQFRLQIDKRRTVQSALSNTAMLEGAAIEAGTVVIEALADDFAAADDDAAMAVVERRLGGLLEAEG